MAYFVAVHCTHRSMAFLALPWNLVTTFRFMGGLVVSELAMLSTEEALLDRACRTWRLLVNSSICRFKNSTSKDECGWTNWPFTDWSGYIMNMITLWVGLVKESTWKYKIMVHINPRTMDGLPSAMSVAFIFTNLICRGKKMCQTYRAKIKTTNLCNVNANTGNRGEKGKPGKKNLSSFTIYFIFNNKKWKVPVQLLNSFF